MQSADRKSIKVQIIQINILLFNILQGIHQRWSTIREDVQRLRRCMHIRNVDYPWLLGWRLIGFVTDSDKWKVDPERYASRIDVMHYGKLLERAWDEVSHVLKNA
jgi:hypothetical protein